jgi:hypothetical protein
VIHAIVRLFESAARADEGIKRLKGWGFEDEVVSRIAPGGGSEEAITNAIAAAYVLKSHARVYARGVARGGTLVVVRAPFGTAVIAGQLLDSAGTIDAGEVPGEPRGAQWDDAAPFSSALRLSAISRGSRQYTPVLLSEGGGTTCSSLGIPEISSGGPTTGGFMALLSKNKTPLSSLLKLPTII